MNEIRAEMMKLRRSAVWFLVIVLPTFAVTTGSVNFMYAQGSLSHTWESYWAQVTLFYGLIYLSVGIAVLASTVWRMEHRGNWPRLLTAPVCRWRIAAAKLTILAFLVFVMQVVLLVLGWCVGMIVAGLPTVIPTPAVIVLILSVVPGVALAAIQSLLSMILRSFAAPIAIAVLASFVGVGVVASGNAVAPYLFAYALPSRVLGTLGGITTAGTIGWLETSGLLITCLIAVAVSLGLAGSWMANRDLRG